MEQFIENVKQLLKDISNVADNDILVLNLIEGFQDDNVNILEFRKWYPTTKKKINFKQAF